MKLIFGITLLSIFLLSTISAEITLEINVGDSFELGEEMFFEYSLSSEEDLEAIILPHILCPYAPIALLQEKTIQLKANQKYSGTYRDQIVQDWFEPQTCTAYVQIISPIQKTVSKEFQIVTDPPFDFSLSLNKKIFILNEDITINYESDISNPNIDSILTYPNGNSENINLPTTIPADQIGTYGLDVTASKEGYKTVQLKEQFGVIEQQANIGYAISEPNQQTEELEKSDEKNNFLFFSTIGIISLLIVVVLFFLIRKFIQNKQNNFAG